MGKKYDFKYIIIGSGPAGSTAAINLAKAKKRVAITEATCFGGSNLGSRDVPYGIALDFSHHLAQSLTYPEFKNQDFSFNYPTISARISRSITKASREHRGALESAGVVCLPGFAHFLDAHTIAIGNKKFTSESFIIATGSSPKLPDISIQEGATYYTPTNALSIRHLPKFVAVVGGGSTGCEIATYFAELGAKVAIFEQEKHLLPREDTDISATISNHFSKNLGISVLPTCEVVALQQGKQGPILTFRYSNNEKSIRPDTVIFATGSTPNLDLGLENAGVKYKDTGILTTKLHRTSAKHIYAIGDCLGGDSSTERSHYQGLTLASNLVNKSKNYVSAKGFARVTNTSPEIVILGRTEQELKSAKIKYKRSIVTFNDTVSGFISGPTTNFVKLLADKNDHIIGAAIVAPHASLMSSEIALSMRQNLTTLQLASTPHIMDSPTEAIKVAARSLISKRKL